MNLKFTKMHGCGNDYVYVNGFEYSFSKKAKTELAKKLSDRHFGIGSDGLIFINPSEVADFEMEMYNADGSRAEMCGNGIRCVAKYVFDKGMTNGNWNFSIESMGKIKYISAFGEENVCKTVKVDMGEPILVPKDIPVASDKDIFMAEKVMIENNIFDMTAVSMGNPHVVIFHNPDDVLTYGPAIEVHNLFPNRVNAEFVEVIDKDNVRMRVWERGTGETFCCGTGCCATVVACILNGYTNRTVNVNVLGGQLKIEWNEADNHVYMTGPAETVFEGSVEV